MLIRYNFSPHDGKAISFQQFVDAITEGFGFDPSVGQTLAGGAFKVFGLNPSNGTLDLETLNTPGRLEHPASLSRHDQPGGDSLHVDPARVQEMLDDSPHDYLDVVSAGVSRRRTFEASGEPELSQTIWTVALGESSLVLIGMSDAELPATGPADDAYYAVKAPKDWVKVFFDEERLPVELGWKPLKQKATVADISALSKVVNAEFEKDA